MARGKVHLRKIENPVNRKVTFSKRKGGMLKKAKELSVLCDAEVGLIIFSQTGKLYEFANPSMNRVIEKYQKHFTTSESTIDLSNNVEVLRSELENLQRRAVQLEKAHKHMIGEDLEWLNFNNLQRLERKINLSVRKVHSKKEKISLDHIRSLKLKCLYLLSYVSVEDKVKNFITIFFYKVTGHEDEEKSLKVENAHLTGKIEKSRRTGHHLNIDIMEGVTNDATPQDQPETDLNLFLL